MATSKSDDIKKEASVFQNQIVVNFTNSQLLFQNRNKIYQSLEPKNFIQVISTINQFNGWHKNLYLKVIIYCLALSFPVTHWAGDNFDISTYALPSPTPFLKNIQ